MPTPPHGQRRRLSAKVVEPRVVEPKHVPRQPRQHGAGGDLPSLNEPVIVDQRMRIGPPEAVDRRSLGELE